LNSVITLISDYGSDSIYTASMLGKAATLLPETKVISISHQIPDFDLSMSAFLLKSVYLNFPKGTFHLICVDCSLALHKQLLLVEMNGHYFLGADNGIFSLLFDSTPTKVYKLLIAPELENDLFVEKNIFLPLISNFLKKGDLKGLAEPGSILTEKQSISAIYTENSIEGTVMYVDGYQNAITNITKDLFLKVGSNRPFILYYWGKHSISKISQHFHDGKSGDELMLFNENGNLLIAMYKGKGARLLGLKPGSKIMLQFEGETNEI
jgi:S-adenosyl-L-methionine hydrolase (adenosine-forming)